MRPARDLKEMVAKARGNFVEADAEELAVDLDETVGLDTTQ